MQGAAMPNRSLQFRRVLFFILSLATMAVIFFFSSQTGEQSGLVSSGVSSWLSGIKAMLPESVANFISTYIRQMAHVFLYTCLSLFVSLFFFTFSFSHRWLYFLLPIGVCFLYACSDEIHQLFVDGRTGTFRDVMIDGIGFVSVNLLANLIFWLTRKNGITKE
jgi:VanZ family protein